MRKVLTALFIIFESISAIAAEIDSVWLSATYHVVLKRRAEKGVEESQATLDIGHKRSTFYNAQNRRFEYLRDSLSRAKAGIAGKVSLLTGDKAPNNKMRYEVYKNYPEAGKLFYTEHIDKWKFHYNEDMPQIDWQLESEDSLVCGYSCMKAVGELRGRTWTVWYTLDIPVEEGPWKLCGLPGLILQASESRGEFKFICVKISNVSAALTLEDEDMIECSPKKLQDELTAFWKDQSKWTLERQGIPSLGPPRYTFTPCFIEYYK